MNKNKIASLFLISFFCALFAGAETNAISQVSNPIIIESAIGGEEYESVLMVVHPENEPVKVNLLAEGDIADWTTFYLPDDKNTPVTFLELPAISDGTVIARFSVPQDAEKKDYSGTVSIATIPIESPTGETKVSVSLKTPREVLIKVDGETFKKCDCHIIPEGFMITKNQPIKFNVYCTNTGNVRIRPSIKFKIEQSDSSIVFPYPENKEPIKSGSSVEWSFEWQPATQQSEFRVLSQVMIGETVMQEESFGFKIKPDSIFTQASLFAMMRDNPQMFWIFVTGTIVLLTVLIIVAKKKFIKKETNKNSVSAALKEI